MLGDASSGPFPERHFETDEFWRDGAVDSTDHGLFTRLVQQSDIDHVGIHQQPGPSDDLVQRGARMW